MEDLKGRKILFYHGLWRRSLKKGCYFVFFLDKLREVSSRPNKQDYIDMRSGKNKKQSQPAEDRDVSTDLYLNIMRLEKH